MKKSKLKPVPVGRESINAKLVAEDVARVVGKGRKVVLGKILKKRGYSKSMVKNPKKVTKTLSFRTSIAEVVEDLERERALIIKSLGKKRSKAKYRDLIDGLDKVTKNVQLLTGKSTGRISISDLLDGLEKKK